MKPQVGLIATISMVATAQYSSSFGYLGDNSYGSKILADVATLKAAQYNIPKVQDKRLVLEDLRKLSGATLPSYGLSLSTENPSPYQNNLDDAKSILRIYDNSLIAYDFARQIKDPQNVYQPLPLKPIPQQSAPAQPVIPQVLTSVYQPIQITIPQITQPIYPRESTKPAYQSIQFITPQIPKPTQPSSLVSPIPAYQPEPVKLINPSLPLYQAPIYSIGYTPYKPIQTPSYPQATYANLRYQRY